jgi:hypothetical protein
MSNLVAMTKNGATLGVHETCVADHQRLGWAMGGELPEEVSDALSVGKGPQGKWFVKLGKERLSEGFETEAEAVAAKADLEAKA